MYIYIQVCVGLSCFILWISEQVQTLIMPGKIEIDRYEHVPVTKEERKRFPCTFTVIL